MIVAEFPHAANSQPQRTLLSTRTDLHLLGAQVRAHSVAHLYILFKLHRLSLITWPAGNLYPCVGVMGSGVVAAAAAAAAMVSREVGTLLCRRRWVLEAVEIIPRPSAKRFNTTLGLPLPVPA